MIFEGQVDEAEVGKLELGQSLIVNMAAIPEKNSMQTKICGSKGNRRREVLFNSK